MVSMKTKPALISSINALVSAVGDKFEPDEDADAERDFMAQRCPRRMERFIRTLPTLSLHLLAAIAEGPVSVVGLAARSGQLKGTVSKHVQRLVDAGWVERAPIPGNRKEIELILTADGRTVADAHAQLHEEMDRGVQDFLLRYSNADLQVVEKVLQDLLAAGKDGVRIVAAGR
ncbi:Putative transcriptional regulator, MarR family [Mycobacteroides abscessus subsp. abscessus]|nr:Putative transcriptional regulator, MarR family [Mycobacteroides abscessus subsp. abscessus]SLF01594.1 Putative transcriptional regulator, MarR family [Mycobacteroides abscessus subsp. abscessus]SLF76465.1 Putative transcriptional regulator, MarR family [Mycobacteroides abscessus subsp. abscessus]SLH19037.1 Putative transcriptional regulator, MarR family [Mycobacteroides abscessus subsp. abscessus]